MNRNVRGWLATGLILALTAATAAGVIIQLRTPPPAPDPPFQWINVSTTPVEACPGDTVDYDLTIDIKRPGIFFVVGSWRRAGDHADVIAAAEIPEIQALMSTTGAELIGDTVLPARLGQVAILVIPETGLIVDPDARFTVPEQITEPGPYERVLDAGDLFANSERAIRVQSVIVPAGCE